MTITWSTPEGDIDLVMKPDQYLFEEKTTGRCVCLVIQTDSTFDMILGLPFFRSFKIELDFETDEVSLYAKKDFSPLNPYPDADTGEVSE